MTTAPKTVPHIKPGIPLDNLTILLIGSTGSGKTAQIGEVAEHYKVEHGLNTRLYSWDPGGWVTVRPYVELGIIDVVQAVGDPWTWLTHAVKGDRFEANKWVPGVDPKVGLYCFEGMTSLSNSLMTWMSNEAAKGVNIGGGGSYSFVAGTPGQEVRKIGSNNMTHYGVAQQEVYNKALQSQILPGTILWTAIDSVGQDDAVGGVIGPQLAGNAKTGQGPTWFKYTMRLAVEVNVGMDPKHVLYLDHHADMAAKGMAKGIANTRVPLAGSDVAKVPNRIEPASVVQALKLLEARQGAAKDAIKARLGLV